jgi:hypothetical protein
MYLHAHKKILRLSLVKAVVGELPARPLNLGALLRRAVVGVELPHSSAQEVVHRPHPQAAALGHLQPPHLGPDDGELSKYPNHLPKLINYGQEESSTLQQFSCQ